MSVRHRRFVDLTDVTLADEDTNSIPTDNANRAIQENVAMQCALIKLSDLTCIDCMQCTLVDRFINEKMEEIHIYSSLIFITC